MKTIQPVGDKILVEPLKTEIQTQSGIYIPETANNKTTKLAKVIALGDDKTLVGKAKPNDIVLLNSYAGQEVQLEDIHYLVVTVNDLLGRVVESEPVKQ